MISRFTAEIATATADGWPGPRCGGGLARIRDRLGRRGTGARRISFLHRTFGHRLRASQRLIQSDRRPRGDCRTSSFDRDRGQARGVFFGPMVAFRHRLPVSSGSTWRRLSTSPSSCGCREDIRLVDLRRLPASPQRSSFYFVLEMAFQVPLLKGPLEAAWAFTELSNPRRETGRGKFRIAHARFRRRADDLSRCADDRRRPSGNSRRCSSWPRRAQRRFAAPAADLHDGPGLGDHSAHQHVLGSAVRRIDHIDSVQHSRASRHPSRQHSTAIPMAKQGQAAQALDAGVPVGRFRCAGGCDPDHGSVELGREVRPPLQLAGIFRRLFPGIRELRRLGAASRRSRPSSPWASASPSRQSAWIRSPAACA